MAPGDIRSSTGFTGWVRSQTMYQAARFRLRVSMRESPGITSRAAVTGPGAAGFQGSGSFTANRFATRRCPYPTGIMTRATRVSPSTGGESTVISAKGSREG